MEAAGTFCSIWQSGPSLSCISQIFPWSPGMSNDSGLFFDVSCSKNWKNFQNLHFQPTFSSLSDACMDTSSLSVSLSLLAMMPTQGMWGSVPSSCNTACCGCTTQFYKQNRNEKIPKRVNASKRVLVILYNSKRPSNIFLKLSWDILP